MPSFTKFAISSLALLASSTNAAPLLGSLTGGNTNANAKANANANVLLASGGSSDLKAFADAFLTVTTGGRATSCDNYTFGGPTGPTAALKASLFAKLAVSQCINTYSDTLGCNEFGAYLSAVYYAYISGWAGANLFAGLGSERVDRWHSLAYGFCDAQGVSAGVCGDWYTHWNGFEHAALSVSADIKASASATLQNNHFLSSCDSTRLLSVGSDNTIHIGAIAAVDTGIITHAAAAIKADLGAKIGINLGRRGLLGVDHGKFGDGGHGKITDNIFAHIVTDAAVKENVAARAHIGGRGILNVDEVVAGVKAQVKGHGYLAGDHGDYELGFVGHGQGKGFLSFA